MIQHILNSMIAMMLVKFILNDVPHMLNEKDWVEHGMRELKAMPHGIIANTIQKFRSPLVRDILTRYFVGYYLIATERADRNVVDQTYSAVLSMWKGFLAWWESGGVEKEMGSEAAVSLREELNEAVREMNLSVAKVRLGESKVIFIDNYVSYEHQHYCVAVHGFLKSHGEEESPEFAWAYRRYVDGMFDLSQPLPPIPSWIKTELEKER